MIIFETLGLHYDLRFLVLPILVTLSRFVNISVYYFILIIIAFTSILYSCFLLWCYFFNLCRYTKRHLWMYHQHNYFFVKLGLQLCDLLNIHPVACLFFFLAQIDLPSRLIQVFGHISYGQPELFFLNLLDLVMRCLLHHSSHFFSHSENYITSKFLFQLNCEFRCLLFWLGRVILRFNWW